MSSASVLLSPSPLLPGGSGGGAGGASAAGASTGLTCARCVEYGKTIMAKCMEIVRAKIGQVHETMQAYIDELTAERDALSAKVEELQAQVHHWHDKFVDMNNKVVASDRKWPLKDESDALIQMFGETLAPPAPRRGLVR